jgi:hypothetical protein
MSDDTKPTNPKQTVGNKKVPMSVLSMQVLGEMAVGMYEGDRKYGRHNYRVSGVLASTYFDACLRHLMDWWEGQDIDPLSGLNHITKLMTSAHVLRDAMMQEMWVDDRPPRVRDPQWLAKLNVKVEEIIAKFPERKEPFTQAAASSVTTPVDATRHRRCVHCSADFAIDLPVDTSELTHIYCSSKCAVAGEALRETAQVSPPQRTFCPRCSVRLDNDGVCRSSWKCKPQDSQQYREQLTVMRQISDKRVAMEIMEEAWRMHDNFMKHNR